MINIVQYFETKIDEANVVPLSCGRCWRFTHGRKDYTNLIHRKEDDTECCTWVLLEEFSQKKVFKNQADDWFTEVDYSEIKFKAFVGVDSDFTRQIYAECDEDDKDGGKWRLYMEQLNEDICCLFNDSFCSTMHPAGFKELAVSSPVYNYKDQNLDGFFVSGTIIKWFR